MASQGVDHIGFEVVKANVADKYQCPDLAITSRALSTDAEGVYWINGNVQNTGNKTATNVRVIATFFNASNVVVAAGYSDPLTPRSLNPSGVASFKVGAFDVNKTETASERQISSYTLMVQTDPSYGNAASEQFIFVIKLLVHPVSILSRHFFGRQFIEFSGT